MSVRSRRVTISTAFLLMTLAACDGERGGASPGDAGDASYGYVAFDAGVREAATFVPDVPKVRWDKMTFHGQPVLSAMKLQPIYVGTPGTDESPGFEAFLAWLLTSKYWGIQAQYGVGAGTVLPSIHVATAEFFPDWAVSHGLVTTGGLDFSLEQYLSSIRSDAGLPIPDAYILFLPDGINVRDGEFTTCVDVGGYHSYDGREPYAVIPPCSMGRDSMTISHELSEMATDPTPPGGWYSEADAMNAGGEIADICNFPTATGTDGWRVTKLWSNEDGMCEP